VPRFLQLLEASQTTRSRRRVFAFAITALYLSVALYPYGWARPLTVNHAAWRSSEILAFDAPGIAHTGAPPTWLGAVRTTHELKISLRVKPHLATQLGPARIFTISSDPYHRDITVAQDRSDLVLRLRTPSSDLNGMPERRVPNTFSAGVWRDIDIDVRPRELRVTIDGKARLHARIAARTLARFDDSYRVALGNELTGDRAWLGEMTRATVSTTEGTIDYLDPKMLVLPKLLRWFHNEPNLIPFRHYAPWDWLFNYLGFLPLGIVIGARRGPIFQKLVLATAAGFSLSLLIEMCQWAMPEHYVSVNDLILNTAGSASGVALMLTLRR
jgi:hypothetical protein